MSFMLRRIYDGFLFKPDRFQIHPLLGLTIILLQFGFLIPNINWSLALLLTFVIFESVIFRNIRGSLSILWSLLPVIIILGGLTFLFGGWILCFRVLSRFFIGAIGFSFFFTSTNPSDLTRSLEKLYISSKAALIPSLALVIIPRIAKDSEDTFTALRLRGEIQGGFYRWLPKTLAILIASVIYRSEFLAQSLYFRGFGIQKRTHYRKIKITWMDVSRLVIWVTFLTLFIIFNYYGTLNFFV